LLLRLLLLAAPTRRSGRRGARHVLVCGAQHGAKRNEVPVLPRARPDQAVVPDGCFEGEMCGERREKRMRRS
jgi:hypothetical protein